MNEGIVSDHLVNPLPKQIEERCQRGLNCLLARLPLWRSYCTSSICYQSGVKYGRIAKGSLGNRRGLVSAEKKCCGEIVEICLDQQKKVYA